MRNLCCAALGAAFFFAAAQQSAAQEAPERDLDTVMKELADGGNIILMRHAKSPSGQATSVGLTEGCELQDGRGLDAEGFFQARFIGDFLTTEGVGVSFGYTSDMCRAWDTARLVAGGASVEKSPALKTTDKLVIENFKAALTASLKENRKQNILLVTHSNIVPLYADWEDDEEIPSGVVLIVDPKKWKIKDSLNLDFDLSVN